MNALDGREGLNGARVGGDRDYPEKDLGTNT
jgi:hypothetical protein